VLQAGEVHRAQVEAALPATEPSIDLAWRLSLRRPSLPTVRWGRRRSRPETLKDVVKFTQERLKTLDEIAIRARKAAAQQFPGAPPEGVAMFGVYSPEDGALLLRTRQELLERFLPLEGSVVPGQGEEDRMYRADIHRQIISATLYSPSVMAMFPLETRAEFLLWARENHLEVTQTVVRNAMLESTDPERPVQGMDEGVIDTIQSWSDLKRAMENASVKVVQLVAHAGEAVYW
jgi:hypothetical protein